MPNALSVLRIVLAPLFFIVFFIPWWTNTGDITVAIVLIAIFAIIEITDLLDGMIARKYGLVTDIGKVLDPFADVMSKVTYFLCFAVAGLMYPAVFLIILYREFAILFVRMLMLRKGVAMAARIGGKIKTVLYMLASGAALLVLLTEALALDPGLVSYIRVATTVLFIAAAAASVLSFIDYLRVLAAAYRRD